VTDARGRVDRQIRGLAPGGIGWAYPGWGLVPLALPVVIFERTERGPNRSDNQQRPRRLPTIVSHANPANWYPAAIGSTSNLARRGPIPDIKQKKNLLIWS
jgi:hypothetical protein